MINIKVWKIILILSIIINIVLGFILLDKQKNSKPNFNIYTEKIDSLKFELTTLQQNRDSVRSLIDTITIKINDNKKNYEKIHNVILSNSINDDYVFFTEYLKWNNERLDSINNP